MLKIFLVEDEFVVREGIKKNIDWSAQGYEFCGEASDGELAYPMIQKLKPDIVITDIKMPFMDGLTLSKLIKKEMPWIEIIILTGHQEFEYAKEGINIGVARYLSKPISSEDLVREVSALALKIDEKNKEREIRQMYLKEMEENILKEKKELFKYIVTGEKTVAELIEIADALGIDLSSMWYNIVLIKAQSVNKASEEFSKKLLTLEMEIEEHAENEKVVVFDRNLEGKAFLFKADTKAELLEVQKEYLAYIEKMMSENEDIRYFGGIGEPVNRLRELPLSFEKASHAFAHRYLTKDSQIVDYEAIAQKGYQYTEDFDITDIDTKQIDRAKIREFLKIGQREEAVYFVEEFFRALGENAMRSTMFRQYIVMDAYFCVADFVEGLQLSKEEIEPVDIMSGTLQSEENAMEYVVRIIKKGLELRESVASNRYGDVVDAVIKYIDENYADEELSLNMIASHVNFSPNHLSMVFSQQTGQTFIKYLTDYRMNKAKELLKCTGKRSSVIAMEVGYKDSHYFSYLFKKTQGITPTQYRGGKEAEGEE